MTSPTGLRIRMTTRDRFHEYREGIGQAHTYRTAFRVLGYGGSIALLMAYYAGGS